LLKHVGKSVRQKSSAAILSDLRRANATLRRRTAELAKLTHRVMGKHEMERGKISRKLQHKIAQTLLGINVRLIALRREAASNHDRSKKDIASTRRLVAQSAHSVRVAARRFATA
jgi:signal transduction histidine kinase